MPELIDKREIIRLIQDRFCSECYTKGDCDGCEYKYCIEAVEDTPTIEAEPVRKGRWIPCGERLPEQAGRYLCYLYYAVPPYHLLHPERDTYVHDVSIQDFDGKSFISAVVAWMPLPEPPKEVQE